MNHTTKVEKEIIEDFRKFYLGVDCCGGDYCKKDCAEVNEKRVKEKIIEDYLPYIFKTYATALKDEVRKEVADEILGQLGAFKNSEGLWWVAHPQEVPNIRQRFLGSGEEGK